MRKYLLIILMLALPFTALAQDDSPIEIDWNTRADALEAETGDIFTVACPADGERRSIWGTEIYTSDSSMCTAAAHMGLITLEDGGEFVVTFLDGQEEYEGTEQNGIETSNWGSFRASFSVSAISDVVSIDWNTRAYDLEAETGDTFAVACPADGERRSIWGTEIYTSDSSMCTAAAHMGLITLEDGGEFVVTFLD
ncbi:MAG: LCCL domain-containing protein, partial [Phototrophicaceae bacterium]